MFSERVFEDEIGIAYDIIGPHVNAGLCFIGYINKNNNSYDMVTRDDFSQATKEQLAKRSGYRCSFPGCGSLTCGPSDEGSAAVSCVGMACHIASAASGKNARRYIPTMTSDARKDISNGIWMCYLHGKLIDTNEVRFSIDVLKKWKEIAEDITGIMVARKCEYEQAIKYYNFSGLIVDKIVVDGIGNENEVIGNAMLDCCVAQAWGTDIANAVRDFIIEIVRNAYLHGAATSIKFETFENRIVITDNGLNFNPKLLMNQAGRSGGIQSVKQLMKKHGNNIILAYQNKDNMNVSSIAVLKNQKDIFQITPCCFEVPSLNNRKVEILVEESCNEYYVVFPQFISFSDLSHIHHNLRILNKEGKPITFLMKNVSEGVMECLEYQFPNINIINVCNDDYRWKRL